MKKRKIFISFIISLLVLIIVGVSFIFISEKRMMREGNLLVERIEEFQSKNNRLPVSLIELGFEKNTEGTFSYEKIDSTESYLVWYGTILGESVTYDSLEKKWIK